MYTDTTLLEANMGVCVIVSKNLHFCRSSLRHRAPNFWITCCLCYQVILTSVWLLGFIIAAVPLMNEDVFGNYYGRNGVCFPLHSDRQEKPTAKGYSTGIFLGKLMKKTKKCVCVFFLRPAHSAVNTNFYFCLSPAGTSKSSASNQWSWWNIHALKTEKNKSRYANALL